MSFRLSPRRLSAAAALGVVAVVACAGPASAAAPGPAAAATWLTGSLTDGNHVVIGGFSYDGTAADTVFALAAQGGHAATVQAIDTYLQGDIAAYADPAGASTDFPGPFSGSLAKLALVAETLGENPHAYGGVDLLKTLTDKICTAPDAAGTCTAPGEFYQAFSGISQALGVIALQRSPIAADHLTTASAPVARLLALRCTDGTYTGTLLAPGDTCATGDVDTTAYAAQALAAVSGAGDASVTSALTALAAAQDASGGFSGAAGINTNSAGVALSAFSLQPTAFAANISKGVAFVEGLQRTDGAYAATAGDAALSASEQTDKAKQATPQALLGVVGANLVTVVAAAAPTTPPSTDPTSAAPTSGATSAAGAAAAVGSAPQLAATDGAHGHLATELLVGAFAVVAGAGFLRLGVRRVADARHRA